MLKFTIAATLLTMTAAVRGETPMNNDGADTVRVQLGDLNLSTVRGRSLLKRRIAGAIEDVCGSYASVTNLIEVARTDECRIAARQSADRQLAMWLTAQKLAAADHR